jgi:hypothetical protein
MAVDKVLWTFLVADGVFVLCGALLLTVALISKSNIQSEITMDNIAELLLLEHCPLNGTSYPQYLPPISIPTANIKSRITAAVANAVLIFITFGLSIPAITVRENRSWLKFHGWMVVACGMFTLGLGLSIWFETLTTRSVLSTIWAEQAPDVQSLLQQRVCGWYIPLGRERQELALQPLTVAWL